MRAKGIYNARSGKKRRRDLRNYGTAAEATLWRVIRNRQVDGMKFRRQYSVGRFILDFYCPERRLAIELDGQQHFQVGVDDYDARRDDYLNRQGIRVLRFENRIVFENPDFVRETIRQALRDTG